MESTAADLYLALGLPAPEKVLFFESPLAALKTVRDLSLPDLEPAFFSRLMRVQHRASKSFPRPFADPSWRQTIQGARLLSRSRLVHERLLQEFPDRRELLSAFQFDPQVWHGDDFKLRQPRCLAADGVAETLYELSKLARRFPPEFRPLQKLQGYLWPFDGIAVLAAAPTASLYDPDNRLHCADGPAVTYADGWRVWAWQGHQVPRDLIECPERLTERDLLDTEDLQLRRWMLQRRGQPVQEPRLLRLKKMVEKQQYYRFDERHVPPGARLWPKSEPLPVPPNRPDCAIADGIYYRLFEDGQLQLVAWVEDKAMVYLRLDQGKASGYFHVHLGGEQYFEDGRMEDFSPWDDDSPPYFVEQSFEEWVRASLQRFPGFGRAAIAQG